MSSTSLFTKVLISFSSWSLGSSEDRQCRCHLTQCLPPPYSLKFLSPSAPVHWDLLLPPPYFSYEIPNTAATHVVNDQSVQTQTLPHMVSGTADVSCRSESSNY